MSKAEKEAKELVDKFRYDNITYRGTTTTIEVLPIGRAKQYALICVDDEYKMLDDLAHKLYTKLGTDSYMERCVIHYLKNELEEVKNEINKL